MKEWKINSKNYGQEIIHPFDPPTKIPDKTHIPKIWSQLNYKKVIKIGGDENGIIKSDWDGELYSFLCIEKELENFENGSVGAIYLENYKLSENDLKICLKKIHKNGMFSVIGGDFCEKWIKDKKIHKAMEEEYTCFMYM